MTRLHVLDFYMDCYQAISYCKICSKEGLELLEECPGKFSDGIYDWRQVNSEPFEYAITKGPHGDEFVKLADGTCLRRKIQNRLDDKKQSDK
jgi:hypothetical protein